MPPVVGILRTLRQIRTGKPRLRFSIQWDRHRSRRLPFSNGTVRTVSLPAFGQQTFTIAGLFDGQKQPTIGSAVVTGTSGVIGLQLFQKGNQLFGIVLKDEVQQTVYYPHTVTNEQWSTGIIVYNPAPASNAATITVFNEQGILLNLPIGYF